MEDYETDTVKLSAAVAQNARLQKREEVIALIIDALKDTSAMPDYARASNILNVITRRFVIV